MDPTIYAAIITTIAVLATIRITRTRDAAKKIPTINSYPGDWTLRQAHAAYLTGSRGLVAAGVARFGGGPFRILTTLGSRVILPARFAAWVKACADLDHPALVEDEYFALYPGFEANGVVVDPGRLMIDLCKTKLAQSWQCLVFHEHLQEMLDEEWGHGEECKTVDWAASAPRFIGRMSSAVFAGPNLARNPEWQDLILNYTLNLFNGVRALRAWPAFTRPLVHWFLPACITCRRLLKHARTVLQPELDRRAANDNSPAEQDAITWMYEMAGGKPMDPAATQLSFAISAMHTTSDLMRQVLVDICQSPELVEPLRREAEDAVGESGWTSAGVAKMVLMDSVIKETQRLKPGSLVNLERKALRDVTLPGDDKIIIPKGTNIAVDTSTMWDAQVYDRPEVYDGYRFLRMKEAGKKATQLVSVSEEHIAFGLGRSVCPGRFMVANEVKVALATILLGYDVKLVGSPKVMEYGFEMLADADIKIEVRGR